MTLRQVTQSGVGEMLTLFGIYVPESGSYIPSSSVDIFSSMAPYSLIRMNDSWLMKAEELYGNKNDGTPVLHNTSLQLYVIRELSHTRLKQHEDILMDSMGDMAMVDQQETLTVS